MPSSVAVHPTTLHRPPAVMIYKSSWLAYKPRREIPSMINQILELLLFLLSCGICCCRHTRHASSGAWHSRLDISRVSIVYRTAGLNQTDSSDDLYRRSQLLVQEKDLGVCGLQLITGYSTESVRPHILRNTTVYRLVARSCYQLYITASIRVGLLASAA